MPKEKAGHGGNARDRMPQTLGDALEKSPNGVGDLTGRGNGKEKRSRALLGKVLETPLEPGVG